jgi:hypothetical protein
MAAVTPIVDPAPTAHDTCVTAAHMQFEPVHMQFEVALLCLRGCVSPRQPDDILGIGNMGGPATLVFQW